MNFWKVFNGFEKLWKVLNVFEWFWKVLKVSEWFRNNYLKANDTKSHVNGNITLINVEGNIEINEKTEKFLRITANNKLSFEHHLNKIYKKVS